MKTIATITAVVIGLTLGLGTVAAAETSSAPDQPITISGKKPVKFNHTTHLELGVACGACHHDSQHTPRTAAEIGALSDPTTLQCATCHNSDFANQDLQKRKTIFHTNCKECHEVGFKEKKGPTKCSGCHSKKKKAVEGC